MSRRRRHGGRDSTAGFGGTLGSAAPREVEHVFTFRSNRRLGGLNLIVGALILRGCPGEPTGAPRLITHRFKQ